MSLSSNSNRKTGKPATVTIRTEKDINRLETKIAQIEAQYPGFLVFTLTTIINQEIVDEIHEKMGSEQISRKIIDTTFLSTEILKSNNDIIFKIISNFVSDDGFPVASIIENGRKAFVVKAPEPTADRPRPHLRLFGKEGKFEFRKKVEIPALPARKLIEKTISRKIGRVQTRLNRETKKWFREILRS